MPQFLNTLPTSGITPIAGTCIAGLTLLGGSQPRAELELDDELVPETQYEITGNVANLQGSFRFLDVLGAATDYVTADGPFTLSYTAASAEPKLMVRGSSGTECTISDLSHQPAE